MKIIFHSCIDGYLTEIQFDGNISRIFYTMQDAFAYVHTFLKDAKEIPQERLEHKDSKESLERQIRENREVEELELKFSIYILTKFYFFNIFILSILIF